MVTALPPRQESPEDSVIVVDDILQEEEEESTPTSTRPARTIATKNYNNGSPVPDDWQELPGSDTMMDEQVGRSGPKQTVQDASLGKRQPKLRWEYVPIEETSDQAPAPTSFTDGT
jgi:hypothetical protein